MKRKRSTGKRPEENSESEFIELKLKNSNSIVNFMLTMITMFYCEQYPKVPPNGWSEDSWRKDTTERLHRDSLWHLEGWTTEVKDMSCSEKMVLDFQNTPVAFSSNRLPISLCSVFQQPLSQLRQFFQATTKYGWCRCEAVCGRPYLKNNLGEVLIKFHSTSKRIPDAPRLVCPLQILQFGVKCHCIQQVSWFSRPITVAQTAPTQATCIALELANLHTKGERERSHDVSGIATNAHFPKASANFWLATGNFPARRLHVEEGKRSLAFCNV